MTPRWSRGIAKGDCNPLGRPCWSRLLAGPGYPWREEPMLELWQPAEGNHNKPPWSLQTPAQQAHAAAEKTMMQEPSQILFLVEKDLEILDDICLNMSQQHAQEPKRPVASSLV
ncbi:hypothetical protein TURU_127850 [Turdus rufiventris]|nr:hypothetical protein TURU_127850 [Turdus rufiventris]